MDCFASLAMTALDRLPGPLIEKARHLMLRPDVSQFRRLDPAPLHRISTTRVKRTTRRRIDRARHVAIDDRLEPLRLGIRVGDRGVQRLRLGMTLVGNKLALLRNLDDT